MNKDFEEIKQIIARYGTGMTAKDIVKSVISNIKAKHGYDAKALILNDNYLEYNGKRYQFIKRSSIGKWEVKEW